MTNTLKTIDPGKVRSFQRVTSADGYFLICALDHLSDFQELLDKDITKVSYQRTGEAKIELIRALAGECSAFLLDAPWVILSAGVGYESFKTQVEIACSAGASGFLAGRSIWRDLTSTHEPQARKKAAADAVRRLAELAAITRTHGRAYKPELQGAELVKAFPEFWYESWQRG